MSKKTLAKATGDKPFSSVNNVLDKIYSLKNFRSSKKVYIIVLVAGLLLLAAFKKDLLIAAIVNGSPVTNLELQMRLNREFRTQTLNQLINEKIILEEARKNNAVVQESEVDQKIVELETSVGGKDVLENLLSQQGQTKATLRDQVRMQLAIAKLYDKEATVSAEALTKFLEQNRQSLRATDSASQEKEAYDILKQQGLSQIFNQKFQELRQKANIKIF